MLASWFRNGLPHGSLPADFLQPGFQPHPIELGDRQADEQLDTAFQHTSHSAEFTELVFVVTRMLGRIGDAPMSRHGSTRP